MMKKIMKKLVSPALLAAVLICALSVTAFAELIPTEKSWSVSFTEKKVMVSDFKTKEMDDQVYGLQPGDYTDIVLNLKNDYDETVDWYMTNKVLKSLEDTRAEDTGLQGGAYSYILTFKNTSTGKETVLFSSDRVGGEGESKSGVGLHQTTGALQDWFYLDTFKKGEGGTLTLRVALEGETQGNDYQDTLAQLQMQFAVELRPAYDEPDTTTTTTTTTRTTTATSTTTTRTTTKDSSHSSSKHTTHTSTTHREIVKTGDYTDTIPYIIAAGVSGLVFLLLAFYSLKERRKQKGGQA